MKMRYVVETCSTTTGSLTVVLYMSVTQYSFCDFLCAAKYIEWRQPKFTFSHFTRDPILHMTKFTWDPNLHITKFTRDPNLHIIKFTRNLNLHKKITQHQICTDPNLHRPQTYTNPILHKCHIYTWTSPLKFVHSCKIVNTVQNRWSPQSVTILSACAVVC